MTGKPNLFNISPDRPFLTELARAILAGDLPGTGGPPPSRLDLPAMTILLPTRRAARSLQDAFLAVSGEKALLLPAIRPIAEADEDLGLLDDILSAHAAGSAVLDIPPAIGKLERQLALTRIVLAWLRAKEQEQAEADEPDMRPPVRPKLASSPAQAARLAGELATLMDTVETERVTLTRLSSLVPDTLSRHWQQTVDFLRIVTEFWPRYLDENDLLSPMDRRNRIILEEARRFMVTPPTHPVIVAGVTGSIPATAELMRTVLACEKGAIVLPGLDMGLDEASWDRIANDHPEHPQHGLHVLLDRLGMTRADVRELPGVPSDDEQQARNRFVSETMRPSGTLSQWRGYVTATDRDRVRRALHGVALLETATVEDEAEAIALVLRETAEMPGKMAALVSPDRLLARRVAVRLEAWGIRVDDSAGRPFRKTIPGSFLDLVLDAWETDAAPTELMALLKHPLTRLGLPAGEIRRAARNLEIAAFRAPYLSRGLTGLERAVEQAAHAAAAKERREAPLRRMNDRDWAAVRDLVRRIADAFAPLDALRGQDGLSLAALCTAHAAVAEAIAAPADADAETGAEDAAGATRPPKLDAGERPDTPLWFGEAGEVAWTLIERLRNTALDAPPLAARDYGDFYRTLTATEMVRPRVPVHPRLFIWGPLEARLQQPDIVILGSLNEGTWPRATEPGAWLNRPMRKELGLPSPEEEIGRAAHDLTTLLGTRTVLMTRSDKVDGVPRVASRWLQRMKALLTGLDLADVLKPDQPLASWARDRIDAGPRMPAQAPEPRPPLALRPRQASVSDVERWIANPYALYARRILDLAPLPPIGQPPGPSERGQLVHDTLSHFVKKHPDKLPDDFVGSFLDSARAVVRDLDSDPRVRAFWLPRLERFAEWMAETEPARRKGSRTIKTEISGRHVIDAPAGPFELSARADRMDISEAGITITDYKTGAPPNKAAVAAGRAPQLTLEAALAMAGAFAEVDAGPVVGLRYIRATGAVPAGEEISVEVKDRSISDLAADAIRGLTNLVAQFDDPAMPYAVTRRPDFRYDYDDYAQLARVGEWSSESGEDE